MKTSLYITGGPPFCRCFELLHLDGPPNRVLSHDVPAGKRRTGATTALYSPRQFLKTGPTAAAVSLLPHSSLHASIATLASSSAGTTTTRRLSDGWEFLQG